MEVIDRQVLIGRALLISGAESAQPDPPAAVM